MRDTPIHLGSIFYQSKTLEIPYFPNWSWTFFTISYSKPALVNLPLLVGKVSLISQNKGVEEIAPILTLVKLYLLGLEYGFVVNVNLRIRFDEYRLDLIFLCQILIYLPWGPKEIRKERKSRVTVL